MKAFGSYFLATKLSFIMTKLLRNEMKAKSTDHEGGSNNNCKLYFPPEIFEIMNRKSI